MRRYGLIALSRNYTLYGDMSLPVMGVMAQFSADMDIETYSIDANFVRVERMRLLWPDLIEMGRRCARA